MPDRVQQNNPSILTPELLHSCCVLIMVRNLSTLGHKPCYTLGVAMGAKKRQANRVVFVEIGLLGARNMLEKTLQTSRKHLYRIKWILYIYTYIDSNNKNPVQYLRGMPHLQLQHCPSPFTMHRAAVKPSVHSPWCTRSDVRSGEWPRQSMGLSQRGILTT